MHDKIKKIEITIDHNKKYHCAPETTSGGFTSLIYHIVHTNLEKMIDTSLQKLKLEPMSASHDPTNNK